MGVRVILETFHQRKKASGKLDVKGLVFLDGSNYRFRKSLFAFDSGDARSQSLSKEEKDAKIAEAFTRFFSHRTPVEFQQSALAHLKTLDNDYNQATRQSFITYDHSRMDDVLLELGESGIPVLNLQATDVDDHNQRIPLTPGQESEWMRSLRKMVPQVEQDVVGESGHFVQVDQAAEVAGRIREFVEGIGGLG